MVYIVLYTQAAHNDLVSIYDYIAHDLLEPIVAGNLSDILPPLKEVGASCSMTLMSQA